MNLRFAFRHALRESRSGWRRIGLYMSSITLGVAALVAINSFRGSLVGSVEQESRNLLGADLRLTSNRPFTEPVQAIIDSAAQQYELSTVTTLVSMASAPSTGEVRLIQLRATEGAYPFYGSVVTKPADAWARRSEGQTALVDPALLTHLNVGVGDSIQVGNIAFAIAGTLETAPGGFSFRSALGPRVYIDARHLDATGLLQFGSMNQRQAFFRIPDEKALQQFVDRRHDIFRQNLVDFDTAEEQGDNLAEMLDVLTRFLALVGLTALLLGGVGVASAVHVFMRDRRHTVAVLRCIGGTQRDVFLAYLLQAAMLGFVGAAAGALIGIGVQAALPAVLKDVLPFQVAFEPDIVAIAAGVGIGIWAASLFALLPLLEIRNITPLHAIRREFEPARRRFDAAQITAFAALLISMVAISVWQAGQLLPGLAFAGALLGTLVLLWLTALLLIRATRRLLPRQAPYVVRQGISSLFRPQNQTIAVMLGLGFGVFLLSTMYVVQKNLLGWLNIENRATQPNLVAFDIQTDQVDGVRERITQNSGIPAELTPIVTARIARINGRTSAEIMSDTTARRVEPWALRREYRHTYRDSLTSSENVIAGKFFDGSTTAAQSPAEISVETDVAESLNVKLGDRITWDVGGIEIETRITSLRRVDWARFATNFFVVFPPGVLDRAPQTWVALARVDGDSTRGIVQRDLVAANPNVSVIDVAQVQRALEDIVGKVTLAVRFMALFSILAGIIVLIGAIATSRFQRLRESVLLKTIGATHAQITGILLVEYIALGLLAGLTGLLLASIAGWALTTFFFELQFVLPVLPLMGLWISVAGLAVVVGLVNSRDLLRRPPLAVLRESGE